MKLKDRFEEEEIDSDFIEDHFTTPYWESCHKFVSENWDRDITNLSAKQRAWMDKILDDCVEKRIEG